MSVPYIVYDDDCGFCTWSAEFADRHGSFELVGFSELTEDQRARLPEDYESCVHLLTEEATYSWGAATERIVERMTPEARPAFEAFRRTPGYGPLRERSYRWMADRRDLWGRILSRDRAD
jgi:predicted DCC family thiol-disulfide oxidoreductase YuxK